LICRQLWRQASLQWQHVQQGMAQLMKNFAQRNLALIESAKIKPE
jgi:hypothetical protein